MKGNIIQKVVELINETFRKSMRKIEGALIKQLSENYPFSSNGIYFLIGRPVAGKSYWIWPHIMITERLFKHPYYHKIYFCSTSGKMDKTAEVLNMKIQTKIIDERSSETFEKKNKILCPC